jgi:hypothetical protein
MNMLEKQDKQNQRNFISNTLLVIVGALSAAAAWWGAMHSTVIPISSPTVPAESAPAIPANAPGGVDNQGAKSQ